jgi:hypothetical protein
LLEHIAVPKANPTFNGSLYMQAQWRTQQKNPRLEAPKPRQGITGKQCLLPTP